MKMAPKDKEHQQCQVIICKYCGNASRKSICFLSQKSQLLGSIRHLRHEKMDVTVDSNVMSAACTNDVQSVPCIHRTISKKPERPTRECDPTRLLVQWKPLPSTGLPCHDVFPISLHNFSKIRPSHLVNGKPRKDNIQFNSVATVLWFLCPHRRLEVSAHETCQTEILKQDAHARRVKHSSTVRNLCGTNEEKTKIKQETCKF